MGTTVNVGNFFNSVHSHIWLFRYLHSQFTIEMVLFGAIKIGEHMGAIQWKEIWCRISSEVCKVIHLLMKKGPLALKAGTGI